MEWSHLLHGTPLPPFPTFFSGAPVIYPPIAALADSFGGLPAARGLSLLFMLITTTLLWDAARRLFGYRAAFFAAALFAVLGPVVHIGSFATYDAMALMFLSLSAWFTLRARGLRDGAGWLFGAAAALIMANCTTYATFPFDPVVICIAIAVSFPSPGGKQGIFRATWLAGLATMLTLAVGEIATLGNGYYLTGFEQTTLARAASTASPLTVLVNSWKWTWPVCLIALCAVAVALATATDRVPVCVLALALLLVPLEQARIHTLTSLNKHVAFGAWFAAIAAGWCVSKFIDRIPGRFAPMLAMGTATVLLAVPTFIGFTQSQIFSGDWPNSLKMIGALRPVIAAHPGRALIDGHSIAEYYLHLGNAEWKKWSSTSSLMTPDGKGIGVRVAETGSSALFTKMIRKRYFQVIELNGEDSLDQAIRQSAKNTPGYVLAASGPYGSGKYWIWVLGSRG